jgi:preprotein translocase subunit SecD
MKAQTSRIEEPAVTQAIETIRNRIDQLGVSEPVIQEHGLGQYQILVQLPGVDDPARVKEIMQSTAMLEIKQSLGGPYSSEDAALQEHGGVLPPDAVLMQGKSIGSRNSEGGEQWYLISRASAVTGRDLRTRNRAPTKMASRRFASFLPARVGASLQLPSLPPRRRQPGGGARQQGAGSGGDQGSHSRHRHHQRPVHAAGDAGSFDDAAFGRTAGGHQVSGRAHGGAVARRGFDSLRRAGGHFGMLAVLIFMLIYYRWAGVNADIALILNLVILLGFMGYFGAVLTLPGIAGVILTVGMGVDSNVLIFERIREELRNGKTPPSAVEQGFSHAWITIVDTHVTTIVSAAILFLFGTGPVKGFATTLVFGLLANLFTAVFVSRVIFDWVLSRKQRGEALSI